MKEDVDQTVPSQAATSTAPAGCLGPEYRPTREKPTATVSKMVPEVNVHILKQTTQLIALLT